MNPKDPIGMNSGDDFDRLCDEGQKRCREQDYTRAIELFQRALAQQETSNVHRQLGTACFLAGDSEQAVEHFIRVTELDPQNGRAYVNVGAVYNSRGEYTKAIDVLRKGLTFDRRCAEGYYNMGIAHRHLKQFDLAIPAYREAIRLDPDMAEAYQNLAKVYTHTRNFGQAIGLYEKTLEIAPNFARAKRGLEEARKGREAVRAEVTSLKHLPGETPRPAAEVVTRRLSDKERAVDRRELLKLTEQIRTAAQELLNQIQTELAPTIREVNHVLMSPRRVYGSLEDSHEALQAAVAAYGRLRDELGDHIKGLRRHEQALKT